jgi:FdhE protein
VVPPGSRQALSSGGSALPPSGYGENTLGEIAESDRVRSPDLSTVFVRRAARLRELAPGHELEAFLRMVAALVDAQQAALGHLPPGVLPGPAQHAKAKKAGRAPVDPARWPRDPSWQAALARLLAAVNETALPEPARQARAALAKARPDDLEAMAALIDKEDLLGDRPETGECPTCGSPALAGLVSPGGTKFGHRHLHCSLCATSWRYVRSRCVHCGSTDKISYRQLAGTTFLRAECCEACHGYSKVFFLEAARPLEPLADDLASLGLDLLVGEEGFARVANPFLLGVQEPTNS